jgi:LacI family transcriptional regulator
MFEFAPTTCLFSRCMATMKDVASHSGVSVATVSAVIHDADWVSDSTRARVQRAIETTNYRPNHVARSLKTRRGYAIGAIVSDLTNPFFTEVVRSLSHALRQHDRSLFLCDSDHQFDLGAANLRMLRNKQVDGLIVIGDTVRPHLLEMFLEEAPDVPVIAIERAYDLDGVSCLLVDSEEGGYRATRHLIEAGGERVAMINGPKEGAGSTTYGRAKRYEGYCRALSEAGLPFDAALVQQGTFRYESGKTAMQRLLTLSPPPDAVFAANDMMALGALEAARSSGLDLPHDLMLVGYDDIPLAGLTSPGLTTMAMPKKTLGKTAASLLHEQIESGRPATIHHQMYDASLVVRGSTRTPSP